MKIALIISSLSGGGAERVMSSMANYWAENGKEIALITFTSKDVKDGYTLVPGVRRIYLDLHKRSQSAADKLIYNGRRLFALRQTLHEIAPEVVISFMDSTNVLTILASYGMSHNVIVSERVDPEANPTTTYFWSLARRFTYRHADFVVAQTSSVADWLAQNYHARVKVIPNPLRSLPIPGLPREPIIIALGRLDQQKGFDILLRAFARIKERFPEWRVVILGDGPEYQELHRLCLKLGLSECVKMLGFVKDVEHWLERASLMVQPSRFEGFPNVLLEAMGMGVPVISADCRSGPSDIISDGKNGRLVPVENVSKLAATMACLMNDPKARSKMANVAYDARDVYSIDRVMMKWEKLLPNRHSNSIC